jgi:hypothetical protein
MYFPEIKKIQMSGQTLSLQFGYITVTQKDSNHNSCSYEYITSQPGLHFVATMATKIKNNCK